MPYITVKTLEGTTQEERAKLLKGIADAVEATYGAKGKARLHVEFLEWRRGYWATGGKFLGDKEWDEMLQESRKARRRK